MVTEPRNVITKEHVDILKHVFLVFAIHKHKEYRKEEDRELEQFNLYAI